MNYSYTRHERISQNDNTEWEVECTVSFPNTAASTSSNLVAINLMMLAAGMCAYFNDSTESLSYYDQLNSTTSNKTDNSGTYMDMLITFHKKDILNSSVWAAMDSTVQIKDLIRPTGSTDSTKAAVWAELGKLLMDPTAGNTINFVITAISIRLHD